MHPQFLYSFLIISMLHKYDLFTCTITTSFVPTKATKESFTETVKIRPCSLCYACKFLVIANTIFQLIQILFLQLFQILLIQLFRILFIWLFQILLIQLSQILFLQLSQILFIWLFQILLLQLFQILFIWLFQILLFQLFQILFLQLSQLLTFSLQLSPMSFFNFDIQSGSNHSGALKR